MTRGYPITSSNVFPVWGTWARGKGVPPERNGQNPASCLRRGCNANDQGEERWDLKRRGRFREQSESLGRLSDTLPDPHSSRGHMSRNSKHAVLGPRFMTTPSVTVWATRSLGSGAGSGVLCGTWARPVSWEWKLVFWDDTPGPPADSVYKSRSRDWLISQWDCVI